MPSIMSGERALIVTFATDPISACGGKVMKTQKTGQ